MEFEIDSLNLIDRSSTRRARARSSGRCRIRSRDARSKENHGTVNGVGSSQETETGGCKGRSRLVLCVRKCLAFVRQNEWIREKKTKAVFLLSNHRRFPGIPGYLESVQEAALSISASVLPCFLLLLPFLPVRAFFSYFSPLLFGCILFLSAISKLPHRLESPMIIVAESLNDFSIPNAEDEPS